MDCDPRGFEWIDCSDAEASVVSLLRKAKSTADCALVIANFTPVPRYNYRVGAPKGGLWRETLNSDAKIYGGSGHGNLGGVESSPVTLHGRPYSLTLTVPPLAMLFLKSESD